VRALPLLVVLFVAILPIQEAFAKDWYISASRGKGKKATREKPAKDLGNVIKKLKAGDVVHIAEGTYLGKGKNGADDVTVPVSIIGGYADDFSKRDPWGAHKTILSGDNKSKNYKVSPRLRIGLSKYRGKEMPKIVVDGLIIDQGAQNRYKTDKNLMIVRRADPKKGENPTPDRGGLVVTVSKTGNFDKGAHWDVTVQNCIVLNSAPTQGAFQVSGYKGSKITIRNNAVINNTGTGIYAGTMYHGKDDFPTFLIENNTVLFSWKYDAIAQSFSGNSMKFDDDVLATVQNNVLAFADRYGVQKGGEEPLLLKNNIIVGNLAADYWETSGDAKIALDDIEDEAEYLHEDSGDNVALNIKIPVSTQWAKNYGARVIVDRNKMEADIKATNSGANALRGMLGLPLQAGAIKGVEGDVWLNRISIDDAIKAATTSYKAKVGSSTPK
jgi:hypothetical protein